ncbi:hypothetical protein KIL84_021126 [Mauremys mutica]|uniref:Uncharacterized protein n=1 Tax=Mauremys mutica TaxID=74926 RepID=A0A9D3XAD8_9SAUR|nr:hypothetical protein KIL84_021126 [Mauremys mutica]
MQAVSIYIYIYAKAALAVMHITCKQTEQGDFRLELLLGGKKEKLHIGYISQSTWWWLAYKTTTRVRSLCKQDSNPTCTFHSNWALTFSLWDMRERERDL